MEKNILDEQKPIRTLSGRANPGTWLTQSPKPEAIGFSLIRCQPPIAAFGKLLMMCLFISLSAAGSLLAQTTPSKANDFVESIGVGLKIGRNGGSGQSNDYWARVKPRLQELGVRHVRDGADDINTNTNYRNWVKDMATYGVKMTNVYQGIFLDDVMWTAKELLAANALDAIEGPNEPDIFSFNYNGLTGLDAAKAYQQALFNRVNGDAVTQNVPVIGFSVAVAEGSSNYVGNYEAYWDYGNGHYYTASDDPPGAALEGWHLKHTRTMTPTKPIWVTETGYSQVNISNAAQGKYYPRILLEHWIRKDYGGSGKGIRRTFLYHLIDDVSSGSEHGGFGLIDIDNNPRPAFYAVKNLISILRDVPDNFTPTGLNMTLGSRPGSVHHTLLQKKNGTYYLIIWNETDSYNVGSGDTNPGNVNVSLSLGSTFAQVKTYLPYNSASATNTYSNVSSLTLSVPDHPLIVEIGNSSSQLIANGIYKLTAKVSVGGTPLRCLDVAGAVDGNGTNVQLWQDNSHNAQRWYIQSTGDGYYKLVAQVGSKTRLLDVANEGRGNGSNVTIYPPGATDGERWQRWKIESTGDGYYKLTTKTSANEAVKYCLDVPGGINANAGSDPNDPNVGNVWIWEDTGGDAQKWRIEGATAARLSNEEPEESLSTSLSPNPARETVTLTLEAKQAQTLVIDLHNLQGATVGQVQEAIGAGKQRVSIPVKHLSKGLYVLNMTLDGQHHVKKLVID